MIRNPFSAWFWKLCRKILFLSTQPLLSFLVSNIFRVSSRDNEIKVFVFKIVFMEITSFRDFHISFFIHS